MWNLIIPILLEGMNAWNQERKDKVNRDHKKILDRLSQSENAQFPYYNDADRDVAEEDLKKFLLAYYKEQKESNLEAKININ